MLLIPLVALVIACTTCNTTTTLPSTSTESAGSTPAAQANPGDFLLYSDDSGKAGSQIDSFPTTQHKLHFSTEVDALNSGQKVRWVFTAVAAGNLKNKQVGELTLNVPLDGVTKLSAALTSDTGWPSGLYKVELYIDGSLLKSGEFLIAK